MSIRVGIDTGGTFTDLVAVDTATGAWHTAKVPSTPAEPLRAVLNGLEAAALDPAEVEWLILGTTVGTNALITRRGAKVAFLTTEGFEDVPFIQRGNRKFHYDLHWLKPKPFLRRRHCLGVPERLDYRGAIVEALDTRKLEPLAQKLSTLVASEGLDAIAVSLLFAYLNPAHEIELRSWLEKQFPNLSVSLSHEVAPVWREYERGITTIADAYIKPLLSRFVFDLSKQLQTWGFRGSWGLMKSNGGTRLAQHAANEPVQLLLSGLSGGVIAGRHFGLAAGKDLITLDMGGTSCDLAVIESGQQRYADHFEVEFGLPLTFPTIDVSTIGAGGGSIAWVDRGGFLRVGPQSAAADPGPACYGKGGTEPTVTDANLILGRLDPKFFLGGKIVLDVALARQAIGELATQLRMSPEDAALAILDIANENMVNAIRVRTVEIGIDPRGFCLVAFGGAGPLHATAIAQRLGMKRVLIPPHPGLCSAFGALIADLRSDQLATVSLRSNSVKAHQVDDHVQRLMKAARQELEAEHFSAEPEIKVRLAMRYAGQNYQHDVALGATIATESVLRDAFQQFEALHDKFYGYRLGGEVIEVITISVTAVGRTTASILSSPGPETSLGEGSTTVVFRQGKMQVPVHLRSHIAAGEIVRGPAIIQDADATTLLHPGTQGSVLANGSLLIEIG